MELNDNLADSRYEWASRMLGGLLAGGPSKLVLDIGAGDGRMQAPVEAAGGTYRGFDLNPAGPPVERWDLDESPGDAWPRAGGAMLLDVIEHCNNPGFALHHIAEALLPRAFLIMTMPNPKWSRSRLSLVWSGLPACFTQNDLDVNHHVFTTWPHIVERLLSDAKFSVEHYVTLDGRTGWPGAPFGVRYPLRCAVAAAMKLIERRDPSGCGLSYGIIARKAG